MRALAIAYAIGVLLACPAVLQAADTTAAFKEAPEPAQADATGMTPAAPEPQPEPKPIAVAAAPGSVQMRDFNFSPSTITVNVGESVTWVNAGEEPHNAVGDGFSTPLLQPGKSGSKSFSSAGTFSYICTVHPQMKGTVKVVAAAAQAPDTADTTGASPSSSGTDTTQADEATGPQLAASGIDAWLLALAGVALLAAGTTIRRFA